MPKGLSLSDRQIPVGIRSTPARSLSSNQRFVERIQHLFTECPLVESLCGHERRIAGIVGPSTVEDVQLVLTAASEAGSSVRLQPIACGKNWGFGSHVPTSENIYLLDLSKLNRIRSESLIAHSVELEPGVTQGQLDNWLAKQGRTHYFNVTGAGTVTSVIGNALERGIGYSGSRHLDLLELEIVLPGGRLVRTSKHGNTAQPGNGFNLGPGVTELFCQSNFGVVTAARIALHRRPQRMGALVCKVRNPACFPALIDTVSDVIAEGACYGVPHIFNRERIIVSFAPHLDPQGVAALTGSAAHWTAVLPIKGTQEVFEATAATLTERMTRHGEIEIVSDASGGTQLNSLLEGRPSDFSHASVAYAVFGNAVDLAAPLEQTGAGLIHVTPLVPLTGQFVQQAVELALRSLQARGYRNPQLSLNAISARVAALVIPISFNRRSTMETEKAQNAAAALVYDFAEIGMLPYRLGLAQADCLPSMDEGWSDILGQIQAIFDPTHCLAPSRYEPLWAGRSNQT